MWWNKHALDNVYSVDGFPEQDYGLGPQEKREAAMPGMLKGGDGCLRKVEAIRPASTTWYMSKPKDRKDLSKLYGMEPVSDEIYDTIMRAENGQATEADYRELEQYMKEKTNEIKQRKRILGYEGGGSRRGPGRMAENTLIDLSGLVKLKEDEDDYE
tara:strand:+ start:735 stop:1205 length:471 start_codon:yes stop_codon:yes gene_type:complete